MDYAIVKIGSRQFRVRDGQTLVVDRVGTDEGKTFEPAVLLGGDGVKVTATVVAHERGPKVRIGKYRRRTGYKRHTGFRAATSRIAISLGAGSGRRAAAKPAAKAEPAPAETETPKAEAPKGLPKGYEQMTVAEVSEGAKSWNRPMLEAALAYEQANAARKGALAAIESALAAKEGS